MNRSARALKAVGTFCLSLVLTGMTFFAVKIWAQMFMGGFAAALCGLAAAVAPAALLNGMLTRSYRKLEYNASPWNSFFGMLCVVQLVALPVLWSGLAGPAASIGFSEALHRTGLALDFAEPVRDRTLDAFPDAVQDRCVVWCRNVGGSSGPVAVAARQKDGTLKAMKLSSRGKVLEAKIPAVIGPYDRKSGKVMLCPKPSHPNETLDITASWRGGTAKFYIIGGFQRTAFVDHPY